jgi:hypothetical protein
MTYQTFSYAHGTFSEVAPSTRLELARVALLVRQMVPLVEQVEVLMLLGIIPSEEQS